MTRGTFETSLVAVYFCHVTYAFRVNLHLCHCQGTPRSKQARYLKLLQRDSNPQQLISFTLSLLSNVRLRINGLWVGIVTQVHWRFPNICLRH